MPSPNPVTTTAELANLLTDPTGDELARERAGCEMVARLTSGSPSYDRLTETVAALYGGIARLKALEQKRLPPRHTDFVFTDRALVQIAALIRYVGDGLIRLSDHATTKDERNRVDELVESQGLNELFAACCDELRTKPFGEIIDLIPGMAENMWSISAAGDDVISGQTVKVDLPLFVLGQAVRATAWRFEQFTKYSLPI
jgi:hypothetical protein